MKSIPALALAAITSASTVLSAEQPAAQEFQCPSLRVPKFATPPTIDGKIDEAEWKGSAMITGVAAVGDGVGPFTMVPEMQQVQWRIGYNEKFLYLAMHSPHKKGTYPVSRIKENDNNDVLFEDHVEIQITPYARKEAGRQGKGFFKMMVNPKGFMIDQHLYNGTIGTEELWSTGGETKCVVTDEYWDLEMSVELARLRVEKPDGASIVMQLVRTDSCTGVYFAGWAPYSWMSWGRFAEVTLDPAAPVFEFKKVGEIMSGDLDAVISVAGAAAREVAVDISVEDATGKTIYKEKQNASVKAGEAKTLEFKKQGLPVSAVAVADKNRNWFEIKATYKEGTKEVALYHNRTPFVKLDDSFRQKHLDPWLAGRPQSGEWEYRIAYLPYSNKAEIGVDLDFFGMAANVLSAAAFKTDVRKKGTDKVLATAAGKIEKLVGAAMVETPELEDGEYVALFTLTDASGKVVSTKTAAFERKRYPFEHNKIGVNEEVIPPFSPLTVKELGIGAWGRTYTVGKGGLLDQISADAPTGNSGAAQNLLAAPMRLELVAGGKPVTATNADAKIASQAGHRVEVQGAQTLGGVEAKIEAFEEYDGWYEVKLAIRPLNPEPRPLIDSLDLVIDMADLPCDTFYVQRMGDGRYGNKFSGIPEKPGVCFKSTDLLRFKQFGKDWKSFVPQTYLGNGDRGLWLLAWSDAGWELKEEQPMLQIERLKDSHVVRARIKLLAGPVELDKLRVLRFALLAAPVKPNDSRYRTKLAERQVAHDTRGYRFYGDSVDGYALHREEDYTALRKFLIYGPRYQANAYTEPIKPYDWWVGHYVKQISEGARICMYGSTWMGGAASPEHKTFGGEWLGKSNWKPTPDTSFNGQWNYQGTMQWKTPEELMPTGYNWTSSHTDFFLYYHKQLMEKCGFNGTWWDNSSIGTINEFDPELGRMDAKWNLHARRQLTKRLNHMGWELMRPPFWAMNMHVDMAFNQMFWMVENDWYADGPDTTAFQQWTLDEFRSMARTKSTTLIANPWLSGFASDKPELDAKIKRSVTAMGFAHDICTNRDLVRKLIGAVDYANTTDCLFTGYWRSAEAVHPAAKEVKTSFYGNAKTKSAVILFFNTGKQDQYLGGSTFDVNKLINPNATLVPSRVYDLETGENVAVAFEGGRFKITEPYLCPWHEYRLLAVEAK